MDAAELVALVRDLTMILFVGVGILALLVTTVLVTLLYRKVAPLLDSARTTVKQAQEASSLLSKKVVKPLVNASTFSHTAGRIIGFILGLSRGKGERHNGE